MKTIFATAILTLISMAGFSQISMPQPSPLGTVNQKIGLTDVTITYSRPGVKDREIFGQLVPYGVLWRTGANMCTKIAFTDSLTISGTKIPKGEYALFTIPGETEWTIILNKNINQAGTGDYKKEEDVLRFTAKPVKNQFTETFTINFTNLTNSSADVELCWENTRVSFGVETNVDDLVLKNIETALTISPTSYYQAARYYYETNRDTKQALEWINKAIEMGYEKFWVYRWKSLIQARLEDYKGAIASAEKSKSLAQEAGNNDYVKMNDDSIAEWKNMKPKKTK